TSETRPDIAEALLRTEWLNDQDPRHPFINKESDSEFYVEVTWNHSPGPFLKAHPMPKPVSQLRPALSQSASHPMPKLALRPRKVTVHVESYSSTKKKPALTTTTTDQQEVPKRKVFHLGLGKTVYVDKHNSSRESESSGDETDTSTGMETESPGDTVATPIEVDSE
ncbi:hypothetical protein BGX29_001235, partial [Mortierella sp. GBA35]